MVSTSKEEKPTAPLLPAVQPAPLSTAVQFAAVLARRVGAHSEALELYYFNTDQCAMYCVLYVFLFIFYNTVFFIMEP